MSLFSVLNCHSNNSMFVSLYGAIQVLCVGGGGVMVSLKKRYEGVCFNVISITRGWVGVKYPRKNVK